MSLLVTSNAFTIQFDGVYYSRIPTAMHQLVCCGRSLWICSSCLGCAGVSLWNTRRAFSSSVCWVGYKSMITWGARDGLRWESVSHQLRHSAEIDHLFISPCAVGSDYMHSIRSPIYTSVTVLTADLASGCMLCLCYCQLHLVDEEKLHCRDRNVRTYTSRSLRYT